MKTNKNSQDVVLTEEMKNSKEYKHLLKEVKYWEKQNDGYYSPVIRGSCKIVCDKELGFCVDVKGRVSFSGLGIEEIPFQFRNVSGDFDCCNCIELLSLKGCPIFVGDNFYCDDCFNLASLEGCPKEVCQDFCCLGCDKEFTKDCILSLCKVNVEQIYN